MSTWIEVATIYELREGSVLSVEIDSTDVAIFRRDGAFYAIEDLCTHGTAALSDGHIEGHTVYCPLHGAQFDFTTGKPLCPPAYEATRTFPVRLRGASIELLWNTSTPEQNETRSCEDTSRS